MDDLSYLIPPALMLAAVAGSWSVARSHYQEKAAALQHRATVLANDRDALLAVVGDFVDAIEHRPDRLDTVAHRARIAIDERRAWTPTR